MPIQPRTPPGVLELLPPQQLAFQRMLTTIQRGFERFGFLPIETPVFELTDVLLTKTGGETEKQVYFVQSTGALANAEGAKKLPELALRFDLTVPLARYVAEHEHQLNFPFRRYQIQRVYRGERAQKGRYREFYQCDIDVIGKDHLALAYDAELPAVIYGVFEELAIGPFAIRLNNRKLLRGLLDSFAIAPDRHGDVLHEIDRLDKMSREQVAGRLVEGVGVAHAVADELLTLLIGSRGDARATLAGLRGRAQAHGGLLAEGVSELTTVYDRTLALGVPPTHLAIDLAIARGLDYYTGTVYETLLLDHPRIGSICSGGRYDNLAGHYTKSKLPGVGISIGATRLFSQLLELAKVTIDRGAVAHAIVLALDPGLADFCARLAAELRAAGLNIELYGGADRLDKQFRYASRAQVPFALLVGEREHAAGVVKVKDLRAEVEHEVPRDQTAAFLRARISVHA